MINIEELSTHINNRRHKSFKLTIESYCNESILNANNWPGGVEITRWRGPTKKKYVSNTINHTPIVLSNNLSTPNYTINNTNRHLVNTQQIEKTIKNTTNRKQFFLTISQETSQGQNNSQDQETDQE